MSPASDHPSRSRPQSRPGRFGRHTHGARRAEWLLVVLLLVLAGILSWQYMPLRSAQVDPRPLPASETTVVGLGSRTGPAAAGFERLSPEQTGIDLVNRIDTDHPKKYLYFSGTMGGGIAIGDVDADGRPDIYCVNGPGGNRLYRQVGDLEFEDVTSAAGVDGGDAWGTGASMADVNNDGWLDIYVCNYDSPNLLYINQGDGTFAERGAEYGVNLVDASMMGAFCDYDRDGDLDLYLLTYRFLRAEGRPAEPPIVTVNGRRRIAPGFEKYYALSNDAFGYGPVSRADGLLRNDGDTFTNVSGEAGVEGVLGHGLSATWWDYNDDGWPDLYVANDFTDPDQLYRNNGDGTFTNVIVDTVPSTTWYSMGADAGDINNDGLADLLVTDMAARTHFKQKTSMGNMDDSQEFLTTAIPRQYMRNALFLNSGTHRLMEVAYLTGLAKTDWTWTAKLADLDNDGRVDAYFTNGSPRNFVDSDVGFHPDLLIGRTNWDVYEDGPPLKETNLAFRNAGDLTFENVSHAWGLDHLGISLAAAHADLDRDGDLDLVVADFDEPIGVYRNVGNAGHGILIQLEGTESNRFGLGAKLTLETKRGSQVRYHSPLTGFLASNEPLVHFGVGDTQHIEKLIIDWPSGARQELRDLEAGKLYVVAEPATSAAEDPSQRERPTREPLFTTSDALAGVRHREQEYDDFRRQPLLPNKLSQLGPGMAWGDADGDGDDDLFVGGAAGDPGKLLINSGNGDFRRRMLDVFERDRFCEDMGAVWFDADGDGNLDLYVVSGGVEADVGDPKLADRLYLNDGRGNLTRAPSDALPDLRNSGGPVAAADFDRDGDVDLFVGGRAIPGQYPLAPDSHLLQNDGGSFNVATDKLAPGLKRAGMVTSALWSDADSDGWRDLVVTYEWGPVRFFRNVEGKLIDQTAAAGLAARTGWWNGIAGGDVDNDGDIDYVVTNFGLNTKYHASAEKPALLYYGDFDNSGTMQLVEAEFEDETLFPVRGKSCSTNAMPFLGEKFDTFREFASASLQEIYTPECLQEAHRFAATTLESGVLFNDGRGRFTFEPLPRLAQAAPGYGAVVADLTLDGNADIYLVHNFYSPQPETGRMAGGLSLLLQGDGKGNFAPVWPSESGLVVPGDAKSATLADLNGDAAPDLVVGINDAAPEAFVRRQEPPRRPLAVRLPGLNTKHPVSTAGARVTARLSDGSVRVAEIYAGGGYLSQSPAEVFLAAPTDVSIESVEVQWPDGTRTDHANDARQGRLELQASRGSGRRDALVAAD